MSGLTLVNMAQLADTEMCVSSDTEMCVSSDTEMCVSSDNTEMCVSSDKEMRNTETLAKRHTRSSTHNKATEAQPHH